MNCFTNCTFKHSDSFSHHWRSHCQGQLVAALELSSPFMMFFARRICPGAITYFHFSDHLIDLRKKWKCEGDKWTTTFSWGRECESPRAAAKWTNCAETHLINDCFRGHESVYRRKSEEDSSLTATPTSHMTLVCVLKRVFFFFKKINKAYVHTVIIFCLCGAFLQVIMSLWGLMVWILLLALRGLVISTCRFTDTMPARSRELPLGFGHPSLSPSPNGTRARAHTHTHTHTHGQTDRQREVWPSRGDNKP